MTSKVGDEAPELVWNSRGDLVDPSALVTTKPTSGPRTYLRKPKVVQAVAMVAQEFLLQSEKNLIDGQRKVDYRHGYKVVEDGKASWVTEEIFRREYMEMKEPAGATNENTSK